MAKDWDKQETDGKGGVKQDIPRTGVDISEAPEGLTRDFEETINRPCCTGSKEKK